MNVSTPIIIGTRGSQLALWQAKFTQQRLQQAGIEAVLRIIKTKGDITTLSFDKIEGKGFFTKEIEEALLAGEIDLAVHSYKDLPTESPEGLTIAANSYRDDPADWLLIDPRAVDLTQELSLRYGANVGTSSPRRKAQLLALRPDLQLTDIRGNVATRLGKALTEFDAVVLAAAGLRRLQMPLDAYHLHALPPQRSIPAPAQGVLAYQIRANDARMQHIAALLHDPQIAHCLHIERSILQQLGGGCQQPIGVYAQQHNDTYQVWAMHASSWTQFPQRVYLHGSQPAALIAQATQLLTEPQGKSVFVSRKLSTDSYLYKALTAKQHHIIAQSLVEFTATDFVTPPVVSTDWVFFSSTNAVRFFFAQQPTIASHTRLAAIGSGTAQAIRQAGYVVHFTGNHTDTATVARQFTDQLPNNDNTTSVLFPQAAQSLQNVQKHLTNRIQQHHLVVYQNTVRTNIDLPHADILVFTSPLNVQAYCQRYTIAASQKIIAIGSTTAAALQQHGYHHFTLPYTTDEVGLGDVCYT